MRSAWSMTFRAMALFGLASAARPDARAAVESPDASGWVIYRAGPYEIGARLLIAGRTRSNPNGGFWRAVGRETSGPPGVREATAKPT